MESPNARALRMGQILADFYTDNPSAKGEQYLAEWKATRPGLLQAVAAEDGRTVEMRKALKVYRSQYIKQCGIAPKNHNKIISQVNEDAGDDLQAT